MKNRKIMESFDQCGPDEETRRNMLEWVLRHGYKSGKPEKRRSVRRWRSWAAACAAVLVFSSVSIVGYAAYRWLTGEQVAQKLDNQRLAEAFGQTQQEIQIKTVQDYEIAYIGSVSGKDISDKVGLSGEIDTGLTYAVVAVARTDGEVMKDQIVVTPFIQGLEPWKYNIFTFGHGSARSIISDGVLYWVMETGNIEMFSDRTLYIAVMGKHPDFEAFEYDPDTGLIAEKPDYEGLHVLFTMDTEHMKADPAAAKAFLDTLHSEWEEEEESVEKVTGAADQDYYEQKNQDTVWTDEQSGLKITFPFYNIFKAFYGFYCQIEGEGIESITYSLDQGVFYKKTECSVEEAESLIEQERYAANLEKECILKMEEHEGRECVYPDSQDKTRWLCEKAGSSYTVAYDEQNSPDFRYAIQPEGGEGGNLQEALENTVVTITIQYQDGSTMQKHVRFEAVKRPEGGRYANFAVIHITD